MQIGIKLTVITDGLSWNIDVFGDEKEKGAAHHVILKV